VAYPHAVALANDVVIAARALVKSHIPNTSSFGYTESIALVSAVALYEAEVDRAQPESPRHPCIHPRIAWVFQGNEHITCMDCGQTVAQRTVESPLLNAPIPDPSHNESRRQDVPDPNHPERQSPHWSAP